MVYLTILNMSNMLYSNHLCSAFLAILVCFSGVSQITVVTISPEEAVEALLGDDVTYSNVTYIGDSLQLGFLDGGDGTVFSLPAGIIMSTDNVQNVDQAYTGFDILTNTVAGEPDLLTIANSVPPLIGQNFAVDDINDVCILEFDFVPNGDAISFNYSFGSDEYLTWINSSFNDVFAFFLSGPGIVGPYAAPGAFPDGSINLAFVPDTDPELPITISSVQPDLNSQYYVDNPANTDLNINGFTVSLTATAEVECGQTYHIKLAIADGSDTALESIVVLEENSFTSVGADLSLESLFLDAGLVEISNQCDTGFMYISRNCAADSVYYDLEWGGTAINGVDYEEMDTLLAFGIGQLDSLLAMLTIPDGVTEGEETIQLILSASDSLFGTYEIIDTVELSIFDTYTFDMLHSDTVLICPPISQIPITAQPQQPSAAPYSYEWTFNGTVVSTDPLFDVDAPGTFGQIDNYELVVEDFCGAFNNPMVLSVENAIPEDPTVEIGQPSFIYCPGLPYELTADITAGTGPYTYSWSSAAPGIAGSTNLVQNVEPAPDVTESSRWLYVTINDACAPAREATDSIEVVFPDPLMVQILLDTVACVGEPLNLEVIPAGGEEPYEFTWQANQIGLVFDTDLATGEGTVEGFAYDGNNPTANQYTLILNMEDQCSLAGGEPNFDFLNSVFMEEVESRVCIIPNVVTANGDGMNDQFVVNEMIGKNATLFVYNRWGKKIIESKEYSHDLSEHPDGTYYYVVNFPGDSKTEKGYFTLVR